VFHDQLKFVPLLVLFHSTTNHGVARITISALTKQIQQSGSALKIASRAFRVRTISHEMSENVLWSDRKVDVTNAQKAL
jgi:hypothetical protein